MFRVSEFAKTVAALTDHEKTTVVPGPRHLQFLSMIQTLEFTYSTIAAKTFLKWQEKNKTRILVYSIDMTKT